MKRKQFVFKRPQDVPGSKPIHLLAGIAKVDITPPPGLPLAGHSVNGTYARGVRTRLYARVVVLNSTQGTPVALVTCDLLSGSLMLHHQLVQSIANHTPIRAQGLLLSGTHTHAGPGNFFGSDFYNRFASNATGFDEQLFGFLNQRISQAIIQACTNMRPAQVAVGSTEVWGATRNRSHLAHQRNPGGSPKSELEAVNPTLHMLRIDCADDQGRYHPLAAFSNFSIHPNLSNHDTDKLYHAGAFAYIERELEWGVQKTCQPPWQVVHAAANFTHADNTPNFDRKTALGFAEDRRIGSMIGSEALRLFLSLADQLQTSIAVRAYATEIDVLDQPRLDGVEISRRAAVGAVLTGGAAGRGRSTPIIRSLPFFRPGWQRWFATGGPQGSKRILGGPFQRLVLPRNEFPHRLFVQVIQVGSSVLVPLPFELTCEAGAQIAKRAEHAANQSGLQQASRFIAMSCSNGYWGYVTTREEYSRQHYEGGHTLYGPATLDYLSAWVAQAVNRLSEKQQADLPTTWNFSLKCKDHYPRSTQNAGRRTEVRRPEFHPAHGNQEAYWSFCWSDVGANRIELHQPLVRIEQKVQDEWEPLCQEDLLVDDSGYDVAILTTRKKAKNGLSVYEARWYNPPQHHPHPLRFAILPRTGQDLIGSSSFQPT